MSCLAVSCFKRRSSIETQALRGRETRQTTKEQQLAQLIEEKKTKILLLGPGNAGKTTILNQIRRMTNQYDKQLLNDRRKVSTNIRCAVIVYMRILCAESLTLDGITIDPKCRYLRREILALKPPFELTRALGFKICILWNDPAMKETLRKRRYFTTQIDDNVDHFLNKVEDISDAAYLADFDDYLRFSQQSIGFSHLQCNITSIWNSFDSNLHNFEFIDMKGQRCERKKWTKFMNSNHIRAVVFVLSISDYDLTLYEDNSTNRLVEAIHVFHQIMIASNGFKDKVLIIFFNKFDIFQQKIKRVPITVAFDSFPTHEMDPHNANDVIRFVAAQLCTVFEHAEVESTAPLHIIRTNALDPERMETVVTNITTDLVKIKKGIKLMR